jgi:hypothetical protein
MEQMNLTRDPECAGRCYFTDRCMGNNAGCIQKDGHSAGKTNAGVNENDITFASQTGVFTRASPVMIKTPSDAINIQDTYNFERLLFT